MNEKQLRIGIRKPHMLINQFFYGTRNRYKRQGEK